MKILYSGLIFSGKEEIMIDMKKGNGKKEVVNIHAAEML